MLQYLSKLDFELKKRKNWRFRGVIFSMRGVRLVRNFWLRWSLMVRTKTPWQTKKTSDTSLAPYRSVLVIQNRKIRFWTDFGWRMRFLRSFPRMTQRGPQVSEISASNKSGKIGLYEVRAQKSATFDPPKPRPQNLVCDLIFKVCQISLIFWIFDNPKTSMGTPPQKCFL